MEGHHLTPDAMPLSLFSRGFDRGFFRLVSVIAGGELCRLPWSPVFLTRWELWRMRLTTRE